MKSEQIYKFRYDRRTLISTMLYIVLFAVIAVAIAMLSAGGGYFTAWFISIVVAVVALMILSVPRNIHLSEELLTINCLLEIVEIPIVEIVSVSRVESQDQRWVLPIFGSFGFFGYFGYYIDWSTFEKVVVYATEWRNMVEIVDIYDDRYYISCREADGLIAQIDALFDSATDDN